MLDQNIVQMLNLFASQQQSDYILHWLKLQESGERIALSNHPDASPALKHAITELLSKHPELK